MTVIHEFTTPLWLQTPLGDGRAILALEYGVDTNVVLFVQLDNGIFKCFNSNDVRGCENPMLGVSRPAPPATDLQRAGVGQALKDIELENRPLNL